MQKVFTSLLFVGSQHDKAEEAVNLYISTFKDSEIIEVDHYGSDEPEQEGTVKKATFMLKGQKHVAMDSGLEHSFTFTPAVSIFVECDSSEEIDETFAKLSDGGEVLMPLGDYGFSKSFAWINDRYGVSWQLNLEG